MKFIIAFIAVLLISVVRCDPPAHLIAKAKASGLGFSYDNCGNFLFFFLSGFNFKKKTGSSSDPLKVNSLTVTPDPLTLGNNITLEFDVQSSVAPITTLTAGVRIITIFLIIDFFLKRLP